MQTNVVREITPLTQSDCFTMFSRVKKRFDFPLHYHEEYELNLILNAKGAKRIVGDHIEMIDDFGTGFYRLEPIPRLVYAPMRKRRNYRSNDPIPPRPF
ncbi:hypothetical protein [uncultured Mucilaginibacter sp.]|uniref:hypothetical protein n=1 Tax=uncultured Mucilaginibacter sp. TaxID=797541 RepID=UPI002619F9F1|nr:hypothetical protein [uncultured Mucilaginibacter sp.]